MKPNMYETNSEDKTKIDELLSQANWKDIKVAEDMYDLNYLFLISELHLILDSLSDSLKKYSSLDSDYNKRMYKRITQAIARTQLLILIDESYQ